MLEKARQFAREIADGTTTPPTAPATRLAKLCAERPEALAPVVPDLVDALRAQPGEPRRLLSEALFDIATADREAVAPVGADLVRFLAAESHSAHTRMNVARPVGEAAVADPHGLVSVADDLVALLDDPEPSVRHSVAWAVGVVAFAYPAAVSDHAGTVATSLDDPHAPVVKHACRTLGRVSRHDRGPDGDVDALVDCLRSDTAAIRSAAATALGAIGTESAVDALRGHRQDDVDPSVRVDVRQALRTAQFPADASPVTAAEGTVGVGDWVEVATADVATPGGPLRGRLVAVPEPGVFDLSDPSVGTGRVAAVNPFTGYAFELGAAGDRRWRGTYRDRRHSDPFPFPVADVVRLDAGLVRLCYAVEGDAVDCRLDGTGFETRVERVDVGDDRHRLVCEKRGNVLTFRPRGQSPRVACFREGRCFDVTGVEVRPDERMADVDLVPDVAE